MDAESYEVDAAAVFGIAVSLRKACEEAEDASLNLGEEYGGFDQFMREVMRVGELFESWACSHVAFDHLEETWPYFLERRFGEGCLAVMDARALASFDADDCLRMAFGLALPVWEDGVLPLPVDVSVRNPLEGAAFREFRIQTVRDLLGEEEVVPFTHTCDPFDADFGGRYFGIYGVEDEGTLEHVADRKDFAAALKLVLKLAPGAVCGERMTGGWGGFVHR